MVQISTLQVVPAREPRGPAIAGTPFLGRVLSGTYRVTSVIEEGGMGTVLAAEHVRLHRPVAVKVLAPHLVTNVQSRLRFEREAEIISALRHPHVVHVLDYDVTPSGVPYLVMELLEGVTLRRLLERSHCLDLATCVRIVRQIASALAAAHAASVVHRDLKPSNVFVVDAPGEPFFVKLLDFGVSKRLGGVGVGRVTGECDVLGTPHYMAPEQAQGEQTLIDHRTDQFALGVITYELLTGRLPFGGTTLRALLSQIIHDPQPPLEALGFPPELDAVLARALSKSPADRYDSVMEFAEAVARVSERGRPMRRTASRTRRRAKITPPDVTHTVLEAIDEARRVYADGYVHEAAELAERALALVDGCDETDAAAVVRLSTPIIESIFLARLGGLGQRIRVKRPLEQSDEGCPRVAFVASRLSGELSLTEAFDVCALPRLATLRSLAHLVDEGVLELVEY